MGDSGPTPDYLLFGSSAEITCLAFARFNSGNNGRFILSGYQDGSISCWNLKHRRIVSTVKEAHEGSVLSVISTQHGNKDKEEITTIVLTQGRDGTVFRWKVSEDGSEWKQDGKITLCCPNFCHISFTLIDDMGLLAVPDLTDLSKISVYNVDKISSGPMLRLTHEKEVKEKFGLLMDLITSNSSHGVFVLGGFESGHILLWMLHVNRSKSGPVFKQYSVISCEKFHTEPIMSLDFCAETNLGYSASADGQVTSWKIDSEKEEGEDTFKLNINASKKLDTGVGCLKCRPDGRLVILGAWDKEVILLGGKKLKHLGRIDFHEDVVGCMSFSRETKEFVLGSKDKIISVWSLYANN